MDIGGCSYYRSYVASLTKRSTSKFWVACFTDRDGRRLKRSTATANRKEALKLAETFEEAARRKRTALQTRRVIMRLHRDIAGTDLLQTSVRSFLDDWLERKSAEAAPNTMVFYRNKAAKFIEFLRPSADHDLEQITRDDLVRFRNSQVKRFAPKTVNHLIKFLRMIFRAAKRDALISDDPAEFVDTVRQSEKPERRPFTLDELRTLLAVADGIVYLTEPTEIL